MRKLIALAMLVMAFAAMPALASVQNVKVGGSIDSTWLYRENFDLGANIIGDETQNLFITQTMLTVDADLTDNVSTSVCLINERAWDQKDSDAANDNDDSDVDIHLAYVTLREMLYSPLTVVVGRQAFHYGNSFIVDSSGTNNSAPTDSGIDTIAGDLTKQTAQDAIRLIFDYEPLSLELLFSKIDSNTNALAADDSDDVDLYGINAGYELGDSFNTQVEAYFFAKVDKSPDGNPNDGDKSDTVYVPGLRASTKPIEGLNVQAEIAWQRGNRVATTAQTNGAANNEKREALGAQFIANYQVPVLEEYKPVAQYVYIYVSGDSNSGDRAASTEASRNVFTGWDPMYENVSGGTIYNTLYNLSGVHVHVISLQGNPIEDVTTKVTWTGLWLDKELRNSTQTPFALLQPDTTTASVAFNAGDEDLGYEIDWDTVYDYTEDVQLGASFGWYVPGDVFTTANNDVASQAIVHGNVTF
ncbi:MAG: hypothetical protein A3D87_06990 [Omnitrophica WOR_2 bacterium RIFCSPHIGHO2_02_FULL_50_17]|nr:MAG: hypothetical protein A3D87_06990 [Omnitrophica WOR_2 bacterium RIFCSPHIGHO2_02_FULL_50_17]